MNKNTKSTILRGDFIVRNLMLTIMRSFLFFIIFGLASSYGNTTYSQTIDIDLKKVSLKTLFKTIEGKTDYIFLYKDDVLKNTQPVSANYSNAALSTVLDDVLKDQNLSYKIQDRQVIIFKAEPPKTSQARSTFENPQRRITGTVVDATGMPLPGVTVQIKGTNFGVVTDFDGQYGIEVENSDAVLVFSYVGYQSQEVLVGGQTNIDVSLGVDQAQLDEVVVVGYGTQAKRDITGSVSTVGGDEITERSVANVSTALQGAVPGVTVLRGGSEPGSGASVQIRGITTLEGSSDPLILVDDVPVESIDDVNPDQIESISVLKDAASAAIYGSRAAAGVVIITTKRAKSGAFTVRYRGEGLMTTPTEIRSNVGVIRYMEMSNEKGWNDNGNNENQFPVFSEESINNYLANNAQNPDEYPITDWADVILNDYALGSRHNLTLSGGTEKVKTIGSFGYETQDGIYDHRHWKRYTLRINNDINFTDKFGAIFDASIQLAEDDSPIVNPTGRAIDSGPIYPATWSDGRLAGGKTGDNIYGRLHEGGFIEDKDYEFFGKIGVFYNPIEDLRISLNLSPRYDFSRYKRFNQTVPYWAYDDPERNDAPNYIGGHNASQTQLNENRGFYSTLTTQALANYDTVWGNHKLTAMVGFENYSSENENLGVVGRQYVTIDYPYLNQAPIDQVFNDGTSLSELAYSSYFGRVTYNYNDTYYLQANLRRDGSSRFHSDYRWGTFPSASLGWVVSNENFFENLNSPISFLKFRASYGRLGNDRLGNYLYTSILEFSNSLFLNGTNVEAQRSAAQRFLATQDITWETTTSYNLGFDMSMFDYRLSVTGDLYHKETQDMLLSLSIPDFSGYEDPMRNVGSMNTNGWELATSWRDNIGELTYSASFNMFDSKSIVGDIEGKRIIGATTISQEGTEYNAWYGYRSDGLYQTQDEINNSATTSGVVSPGDVRYIDISGPDGQPDGIINELDRTLLGGSPMPRFQYGGGIDLAYGGFDLGITIQGVGKQKAYLSENLVRPLRESGWMAAPAFVDGNYWSQYNTPAENQAARYPRLSETSISNNYRFSDYWLIDGSYLRLKNINLGYSLGRNLIEGIGLSRLRVYLSGNDLFSIDNFPEGIDPEYGGGYLITKTYMVGVNVQF